MGDLSALGSAIYSTLDTATTLPVYQAIAPQGTTTPYVVFNRQDARDEYTFAGGHGIAADYLVKVVDNGTWPTPAQVAYDTLHNAINDAVPTYTGMAALRFRRDALIEFRDRAGYWHVGGIYRVEVHDNA
jgi:hypothetical protein